MADDRVVQAIGGLDADALQVGHDLVRAHAGLPGLEEHGRAVGTDDEDAPAPLDVDGVDLEILRGERGGEEDDEQEYGGVTHGQPSATV